MEIKINASFKNLPPPWGTVPQGYLDYKKADQVNTSYPKEGELFPEIFKHPGTWCQGEVFDPSNSLHSREDQIKVQVIERDFGWDTDDKVGQWNYVPTFVKYPDLTPTHPKAYSPKTAKSV